MSHAPDEVEPPKDPAEVKRILIVRPTALGDVCRTVPALVSIRRAYPDAFIDWLVNESFVDAVQYHPDLTGVVDFPRKRFGKEWKKRETRREIMAWVRALRRRQYDLVFDLQGLFRSGLFTFVTGATTRVGYSNAREGGSLGYNRKYRVDESLHAVDRMLTLIEKFGIAPVHEMRLHTGRDDRNWLATFREEHNMTGVRYAVVAPTARWLCKCWPQERFGDIAARLLVRETGIERVVFVASPDEQEQLQPLRERFLSEKRAVFPKTTVGQLMVLISRAGLVLCNDSAALHMAVGFNRPIATIFGPTDPALVGPFGRMDTIVQPPGIQSDDMKRYRARRNDQSLIARVEVNDVWRVVKEQLAD